MLEITCLNHTVISDDGEGGYEPITSTIYVENDVELVPYPGGQVILHRSCCHTTEFFPPGSDITIKLDRERGKVI